MTGTNHGLFTRIHACRWAVAVALAGLSLTAHAADPIKLVTVQNIANTSPNITYIATPSGGSVLVNGPSGVTRLGVTTIPGIGTSIFGTIKATPGQSLGQIDLKGGVQLPVGGGAKAAAIIRVPIDKAALGPALRNFAKRALPLVSTGLAIKGLLDDLGLVPPTTVDGPWTERSATPVIQCGTGQAYCTVQYRSIDYGHGIQRPGWTDSYEQACAAAATYNAQASTASTNPYATWAVDSYSATPSCRYTWRRFNGYTGYSEGTGTQDLPLESQQVPTTTPNPGDNAVTDARMDQLISGADSEKWIQATKQAVEAGAEIEAASQPQLTGPSSVTSTPTSTTTTTTNPTTGETTTQTSSSSVRSTVTYNGNTYNYTTTNTNTTNNANGTTTSSESDDKPADPCEGHPDRASCADLDTPEGEIPKKNFVVTYAAENLFGGGSCPADKTMTLSGGQVLTVWDWQNTCDKLVAYVKPVMLLLATFAALVILTPGKSE